MDDAIAAAFFASLFNPQVGANHRRETDEQGMQYCTGIMDQMKESTNRVVEEIRLSREEQSKNSQMLARELTQFTKELRKAIEAFKKTSR